MRNFHFWKGVSSLSALIILLIIILRRYVLSPVQIEDWYYVIMTIGISALIAFPISELMKYLLKKGKI
jgi:hypothetical protein